MNDNQYEGADTSVCTYTVTYTIPWACGAYDNMPVLGAMSAMAIQKSIHLALETLEEGSVSTFATGLKQ